MVLGFGLKVYVQGLGFWVRGLRLGASGFRICSFQQSSAFECSS